MLKSMKNIGDRPFAKLGENIAKMRKNSGFSSQNEFAEKVGMSVSSLRNLERGVSEGHIENRIAIAKLLKCSVSDLYHEDDTSLIPETSTVAAFLARFDQLSPIRQRIVLALVHSNESYLGSKLSQGLVLAVRALLKDT